MANEVAIHSRFFLAASSTLLAIFSLLVFMVSSYIGGAEFYQSLGGAMSLYWLIGWLGLSSVLAFGLNPRRHLGSS